jgi:hypothetical protein
MKRPISKLSVSLFILFTAFIQYSYSQVSDPFNSDVDTKLKPWTNLEFYNDPSNFQFALVSDNTGGMRPGIFEKGIEKLNLMMPEFVLSVGDLIQGYTEDTSQIRAEWEDFSQKIDELKVPFFYLPGNHDITNLVMQKEWEARYGRRYYYFTYKDVLFIILDSNDDDDHNLTEDQTAFAINALKANPDARWTFVLMHHPIWKYDTGGRFEKIEAEMADRAHTVIAGHEHHYQYIERKKSNYYVLGTTGGGSALRGDRFGEFDHIVWVTMSDEGPVMANLKLDGILSHDISNAETASMAQGIIANTRFKPLILTNPGDKLMHGTAYLHFTNPADVPMTIDLSFFHHHQIDISPSKQKFTIEPGMGEVVEISLQAHEPADYNKLGFAQYYWKFSYVGKEYEDFYLDGISDFHVEATTPDYFYPQTPQFVKETEINYRQPIMALKTNLKLNGGDESEFPESILLSESSKLEVYLSNDKNEITKSTFKNYEKIEYIKGKKIKKLTAGLYFQYYEGKWNGIPDFSSQNPLKRGLATNFLVGDIADNKNDFGLRYTGYIEIPEDGMYYFRCSADDAGSLKIHDELVCLDGKSEVDALASKQIGSSGAIALSKGVHPVEIDYIEHQGGERLRFYYKLSEEADWIFMELEDFFRTTNRKQ